MKKKYIKRQACFACTTPYQILGAINIAKGLKLDADLYIFGNFDHFDTVAEKLQKYGFFANVYSAVGIKRMAKHTKGMALVETVFPEKFAAEFAPKDVCYDAFYTTSRAHEKTLLNRVLQKRNPDMELVLYEDGLGSYMREKFVYRASPSRRKLEKLLGWKLDHPEKTSVMLNLPEMARLPKWLESRPLTQMPRNVLTEEEQRQLLDIFGVEDGSQIQHPVIIFDTLRGKGGYAALNERIPKLDACYEVISQALGKENIIYKGHPRSRERTPVDIEEYRNTGIPMELLYMDMPDLEDRLLICYNSTAVFTPKMLCGKEPVVIALFGIVDGETDTGMSELCDRFRDIYEKKNRIFTPSNLEELRDYLTQLQQKT